MSVKMRPNNGGGGGRLPWINASNGGGPKLHIVIAGSAVIAAAAAAVALLVSFKWIRKKCHAAKSTPRVDEEAQSLMPPGTPLSDAPVVEPESATEPTEAASGGVDELKQTVRWPIITQRGRNMELRSDAPGPSSAAKQAGEPSGSGSKKKAKI